MAKVYQDFQYDKMYGTSPNDGNVEAGVDDASPAALTHESKDEPTTQEEPQDSRSRTKDTRQGSDEERQLQVSFSLS